MVTDLGEGPAVSDALLGPDPDAALTAVLSWAEAMARLHRNGLGRRDRFRAELALRAGDLPVADHVMPTVVDEAALLLERRCDELGVPAPRGAYGELRELARELGADDNASISPSDACPDDNVQTPAGLMIVDFEGAQWRHIAWDLAYLTVPWPTCWCSWRMPSDVSERALERYRNAVEDVLPYVRTARFRTDVAAAAQGWAMVSVAHLLPEAIGDDPPPRDPDRPTPRRRALILHRLDRARRAREESALARWPTGCAARWPTAGARCRSATPRPSTPTGRARRPLGSTACSAGMVSRRSRPAGATAWSPSGCSTACTAATPRSSAGPWHGHASSTCPAC